MPKGGGNKKPLQLKVVQGTFRPDRAVEQEPEFDGVDDLTAPKILNGLASAKWDELAPQLKDAGILRKTDLTALASYCIHYSNMIKAQEILDDGKLVIETSTGGMVKNPAATIVKEASSEMRAIGSRFGIDPASRGLVDVGKKKNAPTSFKNI